MDKEQFLALIQKYLGGEASLEEEQLLLNFYGSFQDTLVWDESMLGVKVEIEAKILQKVQAHIMQQSVQVPVAADRPPAASDRPVVKLWTGKWSGSRIGVAVAAAVAMIVIGVWFFNRNTEVLKQAKDDVAFKNDIAPGKNTATLTLANGKTINLSDAKTGVVIDANSLTYNDGSEVASVESEVQTLVASTPRGGTYQVVLPDGTHVWLNADSKISFPSQFNGKERRILMEGEAYFEVTKNRNQPFVVVTNRQTIEVLGTHFNVSAYADEKAVMTTLLEGKVKVKGDGNTITLAPGEQAYSGLDGIRGLKTDDPDAVIAWKEGDIVLNADIQTIMRQLSRWYNVEVIYEGKVSSQEFGGTISRSKNISEVLNVLQSTGRIKFKIEGRRVTVMP